MTRHSPLRLRACLALSAVLAGISGIAHADAVALDDSCSPRLSSRQQILYDKANAGTDVLRNYLSIRHSILQLDVYETAVWAEDLRRRQAACQEALAKRDPLLLREGQQARSDVQR